MSCPLHFHLRVMIFPAKDFPMKVICSLTQIIYSKTIDITIVTRGVMVQYLHVDLVFATIWCVNSFFLFDSHICNIDGFNDPNGRAVLLEFRTMMSLNNFIKSFFWKLHWCVIRDTVWLCYNTLMCRFQIT